MELSVRRLFLPGGTQSAGMSVSSIIDPIKKIEALLASRK